MRAAPELRPVIERLEIDHESGERCVPYVEVTRLYARRRDAEISVNDGTIDLHPGAEVVLLQNKSVARKLTLRGDYHLFWRASDADAVYNAAGGVLRADNGSDASYVGSEIDLLLNWQIDRHLSSYLGYSHFFAGDFIEQTGPSDDIDFFYAALTYTF